jgi:hypothetical protein
LAVALALVAGHRLLLALAFGVNTVGFDALGNQVFLHGGSALFGQLLVVGITTDAVGVADDQDDFQLDGLGLGDQSSSLALPAGRRTALLKSNRASAATVIFSPDGFGHPQRHQRQQQRLAWRVANFLRDQVLVALATSRILGSSGRGPVAGTPAQVEAALGDDIALVDHINAFLSLGDGGTKADAGQQGQNQRLLGKINHVNSLSKNLDCVLYSQNEFLFISLALSKQEFSKI